MLDTNPTEMQTDGLRKCLELIKCIVAIRRNMFTPFHLGLAIQVYRELNSETPEYQWVVSKLHRTA
jgi:hypothetical protein